MNTPITDASGLRKLAKQINDHLGQEAVKYYPTRTDYNIASITGKFQGGEEGIRSVMKNVFGDKIKIEKTSGEIAKKVSGKYDSFAANLDDKVFYIRSTVGESGNLQGKDLTPSKLGLNGMTLNKKNFKSEIKKRLEEQTDLSVEVLNLTKELLDLSSLKTQNITVPKSVSDLIDLIPSKDIQIIGKNFGEVFLANWCLYNKPNAISIHFPESESQALSDFTVKFSASSKTPDLNVSAKFEDGANASLKSIIPPGSTSPAGATEKEKKAYKAIMAVAYDKILDGLLNAEKILVTPEYKATKAMIGGGEVTLGNISNLVEEALAKAKITSNTKWDPSKKETIKMYADFIEALSPIYIHTEGRPKINVIPKIISLRKGSKHHPIMYAFSVALARRFNENAEFSDILNKAATNVKVEQIYLEISKTIINVKVKKFSSSKFQFAAGAFSYSADNVRMKFNMLK